MRRLRIWYQMVGVESPRSHAGMECCWIELSQLSMRGRQICLGEGVGTGINRPAGLHT